MSRLSSPSITQGAYERLRADLLHGALVPGQKLKLNELCETMGINLSAMREALSRLSAEGLVTAEPQRGFRAAPLQAEELRDLAEARVEIEVSCLRRSISAGDLEWESRLVAATHRLLHLPTEAERPTHDLSEAWRQAHADFHAALCAACPNRWLLRLREQLFVQSERYRRLSVPLSVRERDINNEHKGLLDAALARNVDLASQLMEDHLRRTAAILLGTPG
ncbi:GntR family transcriptional regulator [Acidocella sp.]|uniref:GntR family transcriptional regulator n=1 Tax=Acidocella sp. TaxID=50710 RepID=UPI003D093FB6